MTSRPRKKSEKPRQTVSTPIPEEYLEILEEMRKQGIIENRSQAFREAIDDYLTQERRNIKFFEHIPEQK